MLGEKILFVSNKHVWTPTTAKQAATSEFYHFWITYCTTVILDQIWCFKDCFFRYGRMLCRRSYGGIFVFRGEWSEGPPFRFTLEAFISIRMTLGTIKNDYFDYVRHVWDIFRTIRSLKFFFEITFSKVSVWKWTKLRFLAYCHFVNAITTFSSLETKSLDAYGQSIWQLPTVT